MMKLHLVRHGKTEANEKGLYCGQTDLPLSVGGETEIALYKNQGVYPPLPDLFFTSGLVRANQTMELIYGPVRRKTVPGIAEYDFGLFEMLGYEELKNRADFQAWASDKTGAVPCPGGESRNEFEERVITGYRHIVDELHLHGKNSAFVVCHGGSIARIMEHLKPNTRDYYGWQPAQGRGYTLSFANGQLHELSDL